MKKILLLFLAACFVLSGFSQHRSLVFDLGDGGARYHRIPALATAADGTLVALADRRWEDNSDLPGHIDVVCRTSTDNGYTWSPTTTIMATDSAGGYGDPAIVVERKSGDILAIATHGNGLFAEGLDEPSRIMVSSSGDNGHTWSAPKDITEQIFPVGKWSTCFATSGHALQLSDGRLMFVLVVRESTKLWGPLSCYACYSDDGGLTWQRSEVNPVENGDEAKVVELSDGRLLMSIRHRGGGGRLMSYSTDRGVTWSPAKENTTIVGPGCNGDVIAANINGRHMLLHSLPADMKQRKRVTIFGSEDEGATWRPLYEVCPTGSAYSSLTQLADGSMGILTEEESSEPDGGYRLWFTNIPQQYLLYSTKGPR